MLVETVDQRLRDGLSDLILACRKIHGVSAVSVSFGILWRLRIGMSCRADVASRGIGG
jgi:hypothetical protein